MARLIRPYPKVVGKDWDKAQREIEDYFKEVFDALASLGTTGSAVTVAKDGTEVGSRARINLVTGSGTTLTVTDDSTSDEVDVTVAATGTGYSEVQEEGVAVTARTKLNFIGDTITAADDAGNTRTNVTAPSYGVAGDVANVTKAAAAAGTSAAVARADHKHDITTAAASGLANANAEGTATSLARSDHTHKRDIRVAKAGTDVGTRNRLNLIEGTNVTLTVADDAAADEVDVTVTVGTLPSAAGWTDAGTIIHTTDTGDTVGIGTSTEAFDGITIGEAADRAIGVERRGTGVGRALTIQAGGSQSGGSNLVGGTLKLSAGTGTGNAGSELWLMTATGGAAGTADRAPGRKWYITDDGHFWPNSSGVHDIGANSPYVRSIYSRGGLTLGYVAKTADYTATGNDYTITVDASGAARTITLPAAASHTARIYVIKKIDSSGNTVTIDANASETIDGATTVVLSTQYAGKVIQCDGSNWHIIGSF